LRPGYSRTGRNGRDGKNEPCTTPMGNRVWNRGQKSRLKAGDRNGATRPVGAYLSGIFLSLKKKEKRERRREMYWTLAVFPQRVNEPRDQLSCKKTISGKEADRVEEKQRKDKHGNRPRKLSGKKLDTRTV